MSASGDDGLTAYERWKRKQGPEEMKRRQRERKRKSRQKQKRENPTAFYTKEREQKRAWYQKQNPEELKIKRRKWAAAYYQRTHARTRQPHYQKRKLVAVHDSPPAETERPCSPDIVGGKLVWKEYE